MASLERSFHLASGQYRKYRPAFLPRFILMCDDDRVPEPETIIPALPTGAAVIVRTRNVDSLDRRVNLLRPLCGAHNILLLAATDPATAFRLDVDGIHLSEACLRRSNGAALRYAEKRIVSAAAHSEVAVKRARDRGADLILISPVFPTRSHPGARTLGPAGYRRLARHAPDQACPLGGMTVDTIRQLKDAPMAAVAGIGLFL